MIRLIQRRLIIPQGDTGTFSVPVSSNFSANCIGVFTIIDLNTKTKIFQKIINVENNIFNIRFEHEETINLPIGKFYWDIKTYQNPVFDEEENLIGGDEVDSYYAAFLLPICEIRQTGDNLKYKDE